MSCQQQCDRQKLEAFLAAELSSQETCELEDHLSSCEICRQQLDDRTASQFEWDSAGLYLRDDENDLAPLTQIDFSKDYCIEQILKTLAPTDDPQMFGRLGTYEISAVIGRGGMGAVLKAFDRALNRVVAIKVLAPHLASSSAARTRFAREAQATAAITHDNVIEIYGVAETNGLPYLVMPYAGGTSLQKRIDHQGAFSTIEVLRIGVQIASGLAAAHAQGLVHRDIKPANILLRDGIERLVITDFGLARAVDDASVTQTGMIAGTPQYMSPEQAVGDAVDHRSDLFSLGSLMYTLCTGTPPFRADQAFGILRQVSDKQAQPASEVNPSIPFWLSKVIERLHAKSPNDRYQSATEVAEDLRRCIVHVQNPKSALPKDLQSPTAHSWKRKATGIAFAMLACVTCAIGWSFLQPGERPNPRPEAEAFGVPQADSTSEPADSPVLFLDSLDQVRADELEWDDAEYPSISELQINAWSIAEESGYAFENDFDQTNE